MFKGQCTEEVLQMLEENNIERVCAPANCTDRLQPLDLSMNKPANTGLPNIFVNVVASHARLDTEVLHLATLHHMSKVQSSHMSSTIVLRHVPRNLILGASSSFSRKFPPTKITHYMVAQYPPGHLCQI